jgi:hypothetical protein
MVDLVKKMIRLVSTITKVMLKQILITPPSVAIWPYLCKRTAYALRNEKGVPFDVITPFFSFCDHDVKDEQTATDIGCSTVSIR